MLIAFHKPYGVLSQFNANPDYPEQRTLSEFDLPPHLMPIGRLDRDSEGLLLLTDDPSLERQILHPDSTTGHERTYLAQVEGSPIEPHLDILRIGGLALKTHVTRPCHVETIPPPDLPDRTPPVRADLPTTWLRLTLTEGKNRQVRRMTAAIGHPTLRLIRIAIGDITLNGLAPSEWRPVE